MSLFDLLKKKTDKEIIEEALVESTGILTTSSPLQSGTSIRIDPQAAGVQLTSIPGLYPASPGQLTTTTLSVGLSQEEQEELANLSKDYQNQVKAAKLEMFKKTPSEIRQIAINIYEWQALLDNMKGITVTKDAKLIALELKEKQYKSYNRMTSISITKSELLRISLPEGISLEELKLAHMEASLEEEMIYNEQS